MTPVVTSYTNVHGDIVSYGVKGIPLPYVAQVQFTQYAKKLNLSFVLTENINSQMAYFEIKGDIIDCLSFVATALSQFGDILDDAVRRRLISIT